MDAFLENLATYRRRSTVLVYRGILRHLIPILETDSIITQEQLLSKAAYAWRAASSATFNLRLTVLRQWLLFLAARYGAPMPHIPPNRRRRSAVRIPQHGLGDIEKLIRHVELQAGDDLISLRNRALIFVLADCGLRIGEACNLYKSDVDVTTKRAKVGGRLVRISERATQAIVDYLSARYDLDAQAGRPAEDLPVFARHDRGGATKLHRSITPKTAREIVEALVIEVFGPEAAGTITPVSFRYRFISIILNETGNYQLAQQLAGHKSVATTGRYAALVDEEVDQRYHDIFNKRGRREG